MKPSGYYLRVGIFAVWLSAVALLAHTTCIGFAASNVSPFIDNGLTD